PKPLDATDAPGVAGAIATAAAPLKYPCSAKCRPCPPPAHAPAVERLAAVAAATRTIATRRRRVHFEEFATDLGVMMSTQSNSGVGLCASPPGCGSHIRT